MSQDAAPRTHFDLIVIGGGPGGYGSALYGTAAGLDVALVEKDKVGGTCLHRGCIPAKELLETAHVYRTVSESARFGIETSAPTLQFATTMERKQSVVDTLFNGLSGVLKKRKVTVFAGTGTMAGDRSVTDLPAIMGFGISTPAQAAEVASQSDGVIVGSAIMRRLLDGGTAADAGAFVATLRAAID